MKEYVVKDTGDVMMVGGKIVRELVRCKDCSFAFFKEGLVLDGHIFCTKPGTERGNAVKPNDWYCGDGKRSETDEH